MDKMPLAAIIFQSIPESIILFSFGIAIVGEHINIKKIFIAAVISAFASMLVREYVSFGLHSIIGVLIIFVLFWKLLSLKPWKAIISSLLSLTVLILLEDFILQAILNLKHLTITELLQDKFKRIIYFYPNLAIFGLGTWFIYYKRWFLIRGSRVGNIKYVKGIRDHLIVTTIILSQGIMLVIFNQYFDYINKYSLIIKMLNLIYFIGSIIFLKYFWSLKYEIDELIKDTGDDEKCI